MKGTALPMDFLRRIEHASFPLIIHEERDIQCAAVLLAANLVEANLAEPNDSSAPLSVILRITPLGRAQLNRSRLRDTSAAGAASG
jgi:hypothetical protein